MPEKIPLPKESIDLAELKRKALEVLFAEYDGYIVKAKEFKNKKKLKEARQMIAKAREMLERIGVRWLEC